MTDINTIKTGDTLLVSSKTELALIIQGFENCRWNHAAMFVWQGTILYVAEMVECGLVMTNFDEYIQGKSGLLVCKPKFEVDIKTLWEHIDKQLGRVKYGFFNLCIAQPIKFLTNYRIWLGDVDNDNPKRLICGEFVCREYHYLHPEYFTDWSRLDPSDIFKSTLFQQELFVR
jgi:hypothetical protein